MAYFRNFSIHQNYGRHDDHAYFKISSQARGTVTAISLHTHAPKKRSSRSFDWVVKHGSRRALVHSRCILLFYQLGGCIHHSPREHPPDKANGLASQQRHNRTGHVNRHDSGNITHASKLSYGRRTELLRLSQHIPSHYKPPSLNPTQHTKTLL